MKNITKFWFLEDFNLFKKMKKSDLMQMCDLLEMATITAGEEITFNRADKGVVFFLKTGTIKIVSSTTNQTTHLVKKGNIFGELGLFTDDAGSEKAIVLEDGVVCFIETGHMKALMEQHASLNNDLLKLSGLRIKKLERRLADLLYKDSRTRIIDYLQDYANEFGTAVEDGIEAKNLVSHADIAYLTNTSRQTVSNVMSALRKQGIIDYNKKRIHLNTKLLKADGKN